ncbi:MAG: phosphate acyltransferase PlsX [Acidobacteria bacterium]|nr:phosphate acyltransferase PlsX [Acidobacteriota bacterium]
MKIAVDAMGGDHAPRNPVDGAVLAAAQIDAEIVLVGDEVAVGAELGRHGNPSGISVVHAEEVIGMDESVATGVRRKRKSSIHVGARLVRSGDVDGFVSAGNTGAVMAVTKVIAGTLQGVDRPALAVVLPTQTGRVIVLDVGANVDPKSQHLVQFGLIGDQLAQQLLGVSRPRIGLLSIGEEAVKGNELVRSAHRVLAEQSIDFIGNIEARDLYRGSADVVVSDGFTGNILLKTSEAAVETLRVLMREEFTRTVAGRLGGLFARGAFQRLRGRVDYEEFGGALLVGVRGLTVISHGRSTPRALSNAIKLVGDYGRHGLDHRVEEALANQVAAPAE